MVKYGLFLGAICVASAVSASLAAERSGDWSVVAQEESVFTADQDLLTAGLGLSGLQSSAPLSDAPDAQSLRRLAIHNAWNALALPRAAGGLGEGAVYQDLSPVPGREIKALLKLADARYPFRVLVQIPDAFDSDSPCLLVAPASGSRGVYGAIALAGPTGRSRGCAVVYTDKGAGTDFHQLDRDLSPDLLGVLRGGGDPIRAFEWPDTEGAGEGAIAMKHAHSGDHPEADWGRHVLIAAQFGLEQLHAAFDEAFSVQVLAVGLSNGAGAALRAAELDQDGLLDGVIAVMPNITPPDGVPLYDYGTLAALYQPCALGDAERTVSKPLGNPILVAMGEQRCASLVEAGLLDEPDPAAARARLLEAGFDEPSLKLGAGNIALDLWRAVASSYASAYLRSGPSDMPCGYAFDASGADDAERVLWWATHSGVGPGGGIEMIDGMADGTDSALPGLVCLRELWTGEAEQASDLRAAVDQTRATARLPAIPVLLIHGRKDGLIPAALSSRPYLAAARAQGATEIAYWEIERAQHFDAFLNAPGVSGRLVPILPYGWAGIEHLMAVLAEEAELGPDRTFSPEPGESLLTRESLGLP